MIKLLDGYYANVDSMNYTLGKKMKSKNNGEDYFQPVSYHNSLEGLLAGLYDRVGRDRLSVREEITLSEAIEVLIKAKEDVKALAAGTEKKIEKEEKAKEVKVKKEKEESKSKKAKTK